MPITVAALQAVLSARCGNMLTAAGLDGTATSAAFLDPIATSAMELGLTLANPLAIVDADLAAVQASQVLQLKDVAELRSLETAYHNLSKPNQKASLQAWDWGDFRLNLETAITRKAKYIETRYGIGRGTLTGGFVALRFQQPDLVDDPNDPDDNLP